MAHRLTFWENKEITFEESKKYSSRSEFYRNSHGAYVVSKNRGWLDEMVWLNRKNVYKDPVDVVYKYYFATKNAIYVGRTIYPELRDKQHRTREKDTVYKFSKNNNIEIPEMEIVEKGLTVSEGAKRERYWAEYYKNKGLTLINKQPCGSLGLMCKGKWSREKCFEEAKKYKTRGEFQKHNKNAYSAALKYGWLSEMDWMLEGKKFPRGYWNKIENVINEAKKYKSKKELKENNSYLYKIIFKNGYIEKLDWLK